MLTHELHNPPSPLLHTIQLRRGEVDLATLKHYDLMERQTKRLVRLVDELLDFAHIGRGLIDLARKPVDASFSVREAAPAAVKPAELTELEALLAQGV